MLRLRSVTSLALLVVAVTLEGTGPAARVLGAASEVRQQEAAARQAAGVEEQDEEQDSTGLAASGIRLSEAASPAGAPTPVARGAAVPLSPAEASRVLDRLPPLAAEPRVAPFALREPSLPPPRTGRSERAAFPPPPTAEVRPQPKAASPLSVLRRSPEGEVPFVPSVFIRFSHPMVALDSLAALALQDVPVRLDPRPPGKWRWVDTHTLVFEPEEPFPPATEFRATVAAGTHSATGASLASEVSWSFGTPPPRLVFKTPGGGPQRRDALLVATFNQRVDLASALATVRVRALGALHSVRPVTDKEVGGDDDLASLLRQFGPGRSLVFRTEAPLPGDAEVEVSVGPGIASAEGARRSEAAERWTFRTHGAFRLRHSRCGWQGQCLPFHSWEIELTNPVDTKTLGKASVRVEPELPGLRLDARGSTIAISGRPRWRTTYAVSLPSTLRDVFGQRLGPVGRLRFAVGAASPEFHAPSGSFIVLDPAGPPVVSISSTNLASLRVEAFAVAPDDWNAWQNHQRAVQHDETATPPGRRVIDRVVRVASEPDTEVETRVDLSEALPGGLGQLVVQIRPTTPIRTSDGPAGMRAWVQATRIGLDAFADGTTLVAWATDLVSGRALEGVELALGSNRARTPQSGLARLALDGRGGSLLVARRGADVALLYGGWSSNVRRDTLRIFAFDGRGLYRPGEEVRVKGWVRRIAAGPNGDIEPLPVAVRSVHWTLADARRRLVTGDAELDSSGGFDIGLTLPRTLSLGPATLSLFAEEPPTPGRTDLRGWHERTFEIQEFRSPEFEVKATPSEGPYLTGGAATVALSAAYYAGGPLPGAEVTWQVSTTDAHFRPPNQPGFVFGPWAERSIGCLQLRTTEAEGFETRRLEGRTDGAGNHRLRIDFEPQEPPRSRLVTAEATVMDVNHQAWTAQARIVVHASETYVGLRAAGLFVQKGEPIVLDAIATDLDGAPVADRPLSLRAERLAWENVGGEWQEIARDPDARALRSARGPVRVQFAATRGGLWRIRARVEDAHGRENETALHVWVAGGRLPPRRDLERDTVTLVPDRTQYRAGDVAELLVVAPFAPAEGLLTLRREGLLREERFTIASGSHTLRVPIEEAYTPNVHVQVDLVGQVAPAAAAGVRAPRPAFASATLNLPVPPLARALSLAVTPREPRLEPRGETVLDLLLRDAEGRPVDGEAAVFVVDEALLALTGYRLPDPLDAFYPQRAANVTDGHLRSHVLVARPDAEAGEASDEQSPAMADVLASPSLEIQHPPAASAIRARSDLEALALFAARVPVGPDGRAQVPVKLPESVTRYRVMALAVSGARRFGSGEAALVARLPLMVRPSAPRFLNFGDRFELPVVVQNHSDREQTVDVAVRARNAVLRDGNGRRLVVPANDRAEARFPMAAAGAGTARIQVAATAGAWADAAEVELPVWTPATTEAFATYGQLDDGVFAQPVRAPQDARAELGGLELTTSSTELQALTDAVLYLMEYRFECAEQLSSRVLAVAALGDVLEAFAADGLPGRDELQASVGRDLTRLRALQNDDGGFALWRRGDPSWPYVSIHVAHALARAKASGFPVPDDMLERSRRYLREIDRAIPRDYAVDVRRVLQAYALSVGARLGGTDAPRGRALVTEAGVDQLPLEALGFLLPVLSNDAASQAEVAAIRQRIANAVSETAATAHFAVSYGDSAHLLLCPDRRADAVLLEALIADQPTSDLIPKLASGLLAHRTAGRWASTQENVFVLLALHRYFQAYERTAPDFVARAWLGDRYAGSQAFRGRSTTRQHVSIPMALLQETRGASELLLAKQGPGRLYYRVGLRYAPQQLEQAPLERGFTVARAYESVDSPDDVRQDADGTWRIRAGARVHVRVTLELPARRYHVALVDPLPAGLEPLNPALATNARLPGAGGGAGAPIGAGGHGGPAEPDPWLLPWFDHQNLRDERVEAFAAVLPAGVYGYEYFARATTPGRFIVPPPRAEEMYAPETFGHGASAWVIVE